MSSFNKVILVGNVTREVQVRYLPSGTAVAEIGLAVNRTWTNKQTNEKQEEVCFIDCTAFARTAEVAGEYLSKGRPVLIEGYLKLDQWQDKQSGEKRSKLKVMVDSLQLLGSKGGDSRGEERQQEAPSGESQDPMGDEADCPF